MCVFWFRSLDEKLQQSYFVENVGLVCLFVDLFLCLQFLKGFNNPILLKMLIKLMKMLHQLRPC